MAGVFFNKLICHFLPDFASICSSFIFPSTRASFFARDQCFIWDSLRLASEKVWNSSEYIRETGGSNFVVHPPLSERWSLYLCSRSLVDPMYN